MIGIRGIKPGAAYTMRLDTTDANTGELVARTYQLGIYRGVAVQGEAAEDESAPELPPLQNLTDADSFDIAIAQEAAHTYTECARIWNPIHTDRAVALDAGLPDIILHGTATLALAVSKIVDHYAQGLPTQVTRLGGRFSAMVLMPSTITLQAKRADNVVSFQVLTDQGESAISRGFVCLDPG
jgi:acyl dehydratase